MGRQSRIFLNLKIYLIQFILFQFLQIFLSLKLTPSCYLRVILILKESKLTLHRFVTAETGYVPTFQYFFRQKQILDKAGHTNS